MTEIEKKIAEFNRELAKVEGSISVLETKKADAIKKFDEQISALTPKVSSLRTKISKLEKLKKQQDALFAELDDLDESVPAKPKKVVSENDFADSSIGDDYGSETATGGEENRKDSARGLFGF